MRPWRLILLIFVLAGLSWAHDRDDDRCPPVRCTCNCPPEAPEPQAVCVCPPAPAYEPCRIHNGKTKCARHKRLVPVQ